MMIRLCGFGNRVPNKIDDIPIAQTNCNVRGRNEMGMTNEQDLELGETRPLIANVCYFLLTFFLIIRIATAFVYTQWFS